MILRLRKLSFLLSIYIGMSSISFAEKLKYSASPTIAVSCDYSGLSQHGSAFSGDIVLTNITNTWVYIEQDRGGDGRISVAAPPSPYLLGPGASKRLVNLTFSANSFLRFSTTTPVGSILDSADPRSVSLYGALFLDLITRGLLSFEYPPSAFDHPPDAGTGVVDPLITKLVIALLKDATTKANVDTVAVDIGNDVRNRDFGSLTQDIVTVALKSGEVKDALSEALKKSLTSEQVQKLFDEANGYLGFVGGLLDVVGRSESLLVLWQGTRSAPPSGWFELSFSSQAPVSLDAPTLLPAKSVSSSQINLKWVNNTSQEDGFKIFRRSGAGGTWQLVKTIVTKDAESYSDTTLSPNTTYYYQVAAYNSFGTSNSNIVSGTTLGASGSNYTLNVNASNASSGQAVLAAVSSWLGTTTDYKQQTAPCTRSVPAGTSVSVSAASTLADGSVFQYWQPSWGDRIFNTWVTINLGSSETITAVYGSSTASSPVRTVQNASVVGPSSVDEGESAAYKLRLIFSDGSQEYRSAAWNVDPISAAHISSAGILDAGAVDADRTIEVTAKASIDGVQKSVTSVVTIQNTVSLPSYSLTLGTSNPDAGGAIPSPFAKSFTAGSTVRLTANANFGYHFTGWSGDASGTTNPIELVMNGNKSVTANYAPGDDRMGTVVITIQPPEAAAAGVKWGWNDADYRDSGTSTTGFPGSYIFAIHPVDGWIGPTSKLVTITAGQTNSVVATFTRDTTPGTLSVTLTPPDAVTAGAKWHVNGGAAQSSGASVPLPPGSGYAITFDAAPGWTAPASQSVNIARAQSTIVTGNYTPPVGQPVITAVHPGFGSLAGGTALTIEGVNFTAPATVLIGGKPASNITVISATQITCQTPANSVYGTVPVTVQTAGGSATNANGFTYGITRGKGVELVSAIGGWVNAVAVRGNYAYIGEGSSFVTLDISNPASPSPIGRLTMPGMVQDIALSGHYALVADNDAGLQVVDISTPTAPKLVGFYNTPGVAEGLAVLGNNVYLVDGNSGILVFDVTTPTRPTLISSTDLAGFARGIAVSASGNGVFAYSLVNTDLVIVDITVPLSPRVRGRIGIPFGGFSLAVSGTRVFVANSDRLRMIDVSDPDAPIDLGQAPNVTMPFSVAVSNNLVYEGGFSGLTIWSYSGQTMSLIGANNSAVSNGSKMVVSGGRAYLAGGAHGFMVADTSNLSSPLKIGSLSALSGDYNCVAVSGSYVYAGVNNSFKVFDISNPALPKQIGQFEMNGSDGKILISNGFAYVNGVGTEIKILNITNPASPTLFGTIPVTTIHAMKTAVVGNNLLIAGFDTNNRPKFVVADISNPASPVIRSSVNLTTAAGFDWPTSIAVNGNTAVVSLGSSKQLRLLDISNLNSPIERGSLGDVARASDIAMSADGRCAFVANDIDNTLMVVDVSDPAHPTQIANVPLAALPGALGMRDNILYVIGGSNLLSFDVSNPATPIPTQSYAMPSSVSSPYYGISIAKGSSNGGDLIYVGDSVAGLVVLRTEDTEVPKVYITDPTFSAAYQTVAGTLTLGGSANDNQGVTRVAWSNNRGGGGDAAGTAFWSVADIPLASGVNVITVSALDGSGNTGTATLTVTYAPPDTVAPVVTISRPPLDENFTVNESSLKLTGSAADDQGVASVMWKNERGGSGTAAVADGRWTVTNLPLQEGPNQISVTATDAAGNSASVSSTIFYLPPDGTPPVVSIDFPTENVTYETSAGTINLSGQSSDNQLVSRVAWSSSRGGAGVANGTAPWSVNDIVLQPGLNVIDVIATDASGNTAADSISVNYTPVYTLSLAATNGVITTNADGSDFVSGSEVLLTATPVAGYRFTGWSGDAAGSANPLSLTMAADKNIAAIFALITDDSDADGIADGWELKYFGNLTTAGIGTDSNHDGFTDAEAIRRGMNPMVVLPKVRQPDAMVGFGARAMVGNGVYDSAGGGQSLSAPLRRGTSKTCLVYVRNDGSMLNNIVVSGTGVGPHFTVRYFYGAADVTARVVRGTLVFPRMRPGAAVILRAVITARMTARSGEETDIFVSATSVGDQTAKDTVHYGVTVP